MFVIKRVSFFLKHVRMNKVVVVELLGEGIDENILGLIPNILDLMVENIQKYLLISTVFVFQY